MLDASIPLSVKNLNIQPAIDNYRESAKAVADQQMQAATLRDMQQQREVRAEQLKSAKLQSAEEVRRAHEEQTLRGLAQVNDITTPEGQGQYLKDAQALGLGHKVPEIAATFAANAAAQRKAAEEAVKAKRQEGIDRLDLRARLLPQATDQASYDTVKRRLKNFGDDLEGLEPTFNPTAVKAHIGEVLTHKDQLEQIHKAAEEAAKADNMALEDKKLGETARHNKAMEGIDATKAAKEKEAKQPTADQSKVATFGRRVQQSMAEMDRLIASGYDRSEAKNGVNSKLPNALMTDLNQEQAQAERNFINAVLRRESGAAISSGEFSSAEKQYFPRTGDSKAVLEQKARNRQQVMEGFQAEAGPAWEKVDAVLPGTAAKIGRFQVEVH